MPSDPLEDTLLFKWGTQIEAFAEARKRAAARIFVPTGKIVIRKVNPTKSSTSKPATPSRRKA